MKNLFSYGAGVLIGLLVSFAEVNAQYVWQKQFSPVNSDLVSVSFVDDLHGWIATNDGTILTTEDAGRNWHSIAQIENIEPSAIFFRNTNLGWMTGQYNSILDSTFILRTIDGGATWEPVFQKNLCRLNDVFFIDDAMGWTAGSDVLEPDTLSLIMYTIDGGETWIQCFGSRVQNELYSINFRDSNYGQACGQDGLFFGTNTGGRDLLFGWSMDVSISSYRKDLYGIFNAGTNYGCAVGEDGFVLFTKDNWSNYLNKSTTSEDTLLAVSGLSPGLSYWAAGKNGCIVNIKYALYMLFITEEARITSNDLNDICAVNANHIWAVGENGTILFYNDNNPPVAVDDEVTVRQDSMKMIFVLTNDYDIDNDELRIYSFSEGNHGSVTQSFGGDYLLFDPDDDYVGKDTLQYVVTDDQGGFNTGNVYIEITEAPPGPFEQIVVNFDSVAFGNAIWGDIDNDKDYDILVCGQKKDGTRITSLYLNNEGAFEKVSANLEGVSPRNDHAMAFIDLNNDGYLDFIITGENNDGVAITDLYIYEFGLQYEKYETGIPGVVDGSVDWGDYDNDGDMDLLISGENNTSGEICEIYRNEGKSDAHNSWKFTSANKNFHPLYESVARFVDLNKDDNLDVVAMGTDHLHDIKGYYYLNNEGLFTSGELTGHNNGSIDYCDFNTDGKIEILVTGDTSFSGPNPSSQLLKFDQGNFVEIGQDIEDVSISSADWGDYDNDGDYDLLLSGMNKQLAYFTIIYENKNNSLVNSGIRLPGMASGTVCWGDYDYDGDLDILLSGYVNTSPSRLTAIFKNNLEIQNQYPSLPGNLSVSQTGIDVTISWDPATDSETPSDGLTYNVSLKRKHLNKYRLRPPVEDDGTVKLTIPGNAFDNKILFRELDEGALYTCQVQTVDAGFHTSEWAEFDFNTASDYFLEQDFAIPHAGILSAEWIDFNSDNDLELFASGYDSSSKLFSRLYPVINDTLNDQYVKLDSAYFNQEVQILDFNNDNILDFAAGFTSDSCIKISVTGYGDTLIKTGFYMGSFAWGDYENDGDEDLIITGALSYDMYGSKLFRNNNGILENYNILISGAIYGDIEWVDFDNDGDMDIALCGYNNSEGCITKIYENYNGAFIDTHMDLLGLAQSDMDFSDYDEDGDLDLLICGYSNENIVRTIIYENENNRYIPKPYLLAQIVQGSCKWVDINSDGYSDIVLSGINDNSLYSENKITKIYIWKDGNYIDAATLQGLSKPIIAPGDYNGDYKVDLLIAGESGSTSTGYLYKNVTQIYNHSPYAPENINIISHDDHVEVEWTKVFDPSKHNEITYNIRMGTTPGGSQIISPKSNLYGTRKVVGPGNAQNRTFATINGLSPDTTYYLSVQSVDASFLGSNFSDEIAFNPVSGYFLPETIILSDKNITSAAWVDYDSDEDLDLMVRSEEEEIISNPGIYQNNDGEIDTALMEIETNSFTNELLINDFDNDNDPDLLLFPGSLNFQNTLLENVNGTYNIEQLDLAGLSNSNSAWGDFDNDGDEDLIIMGTDASGTNNTTYLYKNNNGSFESFDNLMKAIIDGKLSWIDIDNDGDKDIVRSGYTKNLHPEPEDVKFIISENMGGAFRSLYPDIPALVLCDMDFGDYDNDGDLDMLYCGASLDDNKAHTYICSNENGIFTIADSITPVCRGHCKWVDIEDDGLMDIIIFGYIDPTSDYNSPDAELVAEVFRNTGNGFIKIASLETFLYPSLAIGDFDNDGLPDVFLGGKKPDNKITGIIYKNSNHLKNITGPPNLYPAEVFQDSVRIHWRFPTSGRLYYNLRIGTTPGGNDVLSSLSHDDGYRKVVNIGNMQETHSFTLKDPKSSTTYYYSIQSINREFIGSVWSQEMEFVTLPTGVDDLITDENMAKVYPNPVQEELNIELEITNPASIDIELYNETGIKMISKQLKGVSGINKTTISIPDKGIYILKIFYENHVITKKIISVY